LFKSTNLFNRGNHKIDGIFFANQQAPNIDVGAGLKYANQNGHGASLTATNTYQFAPVPQRIPGTNIDLTGQYRLYTSKRGNTLDAYGGVSQTFSHLGNSAPQYNAGLRFRFRRQVGVIGGARNLLEREPPVQFKEI
jgi:hypothetical protein